MKDFEAFANEVVGPIRASIHRKKSIREEVLGHLNEAADRAREEGVPEAEVVARVLSQFGDAATVRKEVAATIPALERMLYRRFHDRREGEGDLRYTARVSVMLSLLAVVCVGGGMVISGMRKGFSWTDPLSLFGVAAVTFTFAFGLLLIDMRMRRNVQQGKWRVALLQCLAACGAVGPVPILASYVIALEAPGVPGVMLIGTLAGIGLAVIMFSISLGGAYWASRNCLWIDDLGRDL